MKKVLITGVNGQIGSELIEELKIHHGCKNVIGLDIRQPTDITNNNFTITDVTDKKGIQEVIDKYNIDTIYHLASILSAKGESNPDQTWYVNLNGLKNILDLARKYKIRVFWPSSIAVFGPQSPKHNTPQTTVLDPKTMYGITKLTGELLCNYYFDRFGVDVRSIRYPGIISYKTLPGGGTTDYAVEIFYNAIKKKEYHCFVKPKTRLPMIYMDDAIKAALEIMTVDQSKIKIRTSYNLMATSFSVEELANEIKKYIPDFKCYYAPDHRQKIADSWPEAIDDSRARRDWNWEHKYDLSLIVSDMIEKISHKYSLGESDE
jgi:nucleoside-diphosphate-sugar epimerase